MEEIVWCFVIAWLIAVLVYFLGLLAGMTKDFLINIFRNNGTE